MSFNDIFEHNNTYYSSSLKKNSRTVRLLHVDPGNFNDPLVCISETVPLKQAKFTALSYVWGTNAKPFAIQLDGRPDFWVTESAYAALRRIRKADTKLTVWVDAICIRQTDVKERNAQVAMMGAVYRQAELVIAYLGPCPTSLAGTEEGELCLKQDLHDDPKPSVAVELFPQSEESLVHKWWCRVWTMQEAVNPKDLDFIVGPHRYSYHDFYGMIFDAWEGIATRTSIIGDLYLALRQIHQQRSVSRGSNLHDALTDTCRRHASDPRDKIFAALALLESDEAATAAEYIKINYRSRPESIACRAMYALIDPMEDLDCIFTLPSGAYWSRKPPPWPSWAPALLEPIPDESQKMRLSCDGLEVCAGLDQYLGEESELPEEDIWHETELDGLVLCTRGIHFDYVEITAAPQGESWLVSTQGSDDSAQVTPSQQTAEGLLHMFRAQFASSRSSAEVEVGQSALAIQKGDFGGLEEIANMTEWSSDIEQMHKGELIFVTEAGFVGFAHDVLPGDKISVLFNCKYPTVLRKVAGGHRLVGDARIKSIMYGQLAKLYQQGKVKSKMYRIK